jgi:hypothetical protein
MGLLYEDLTKGIISAFYKVYNQLGYGFLEKVYQNALYYELKAQGYDCKAQYKIDVYYLKATNIEVGLLFNFGEKPEYKRKIFMNKNKKYDKYDK